MGEDITDLTTAEGNAYVMPGDEYDPEQAGSAHHAPETVEPETATVYPAPGKQQETAMALLEASRDEAESRTIQWSDGAFVAPKDLVDRAVIPEADPEPDDEPDDVDGDGPIPAKSATKDVWVDYAVSKGADRTQAEASTKDDLIAAYGEVTPPTA